MDLDDAVVPEEAPKNHSYQRWIDAGNGYKISVDNNHVAWDSAAEFLETRPEEMRHVDQVIWAYLDGKPRQYQLFGGVADANLKLSVANGPFYPVFSDSDAAIAGGLEPGDFYITSTGAMMQVLSPAV